MSVGRYACQASAAAALPACATAVHATPGMKRPAGLPGDMRGQGAAARSADEQLLLREGAPCCGRGAEGLQRCCHCPAGAAARPPV
eukprot:1142961-Pelagomonas_calceolata.AAC.5